MREPVAERQWLTARVKHNADHELMADTASQSLDAAEILGPHGLGCLHLARDHFAGCRFKDGIDLVLVPVAVVVEADRLVGDGKLACQFAEHEGLDQRSDWCCRLAARRRLMPVR